MMPASTGSVMWCDDRAVGEPADGVGLRRVLLTLCVTEITS
jgi:hypothetical protein